MEKAEIGNAILYRADCIEVMRGLGKNYCDALITDIPYGEVNRKSNGLRVLDKGAADIETFDLADFLTLAEKAFTGSFYCFCGTEQLSEIRRFMVNAGHSTRAGVWEKNNPSPMNGDKLWLSGLELCCYAKKSGATFNENCVSPVWRCNVGTAKEHPTEKPVKLMGRLVRASTNEGDTVFDPCMGSGTTGVAALEEGRKFIGVEYSRKYFALACRRIERAQQQQRLFA